MAEPAARLAGGNGGSGGSGGTGPGTMAKTGQAQTDNPPNTEAIVSLSVLDLSAPLIVYGTVIRRGAGVQRPPFGRDRLMELLG